MFAGTGKAATLKVKDPMILHPLDEFTDFSTSPAIRFVTCCLKKQNDPGSSYQFIRKDNRI